MGIENYKLIASTLVGQGRPNEVLVMEGTTVKSGKTPGGWRQSLARMFDVPDTGHEAASTERKFAQEISGLRCLAGFIQSLHEQYDADIVNMCVRDCGLTGEKSLTARVVGDAIALADRQVENRTRNAMATMNFLESSHWSGPPLKSSGAELLEKVADPETQRFMTAYVNKKLAATQLFTAGRVDEAQLMALADEALDLLGEMQGLPGVSGARLKEMLRRTAQMDSIIEMRRSVQAEALVVAAERRLDMTDEHSDFAVRVSRICGANPALSVTTEVIHGLCADARKYALDTAASMTTRILSVAEMEAAHAEIGKTMMGAVEQALKAHCAALTEIGTHPAFSPEQRVMLEDLGEQERLDESRVTVYAALVGPLATSVGALGMALNGMLTVKNFKTENFNAAILALETIEKQVVAQVATLKGPADNVLSAGSQARSFDSLLYQALALAIADQTVDSAADALAALTGEGGNALMQGLMCAPDHYRSSRLTLVLSSLVEATARHAGKSETNAIAQATRQVMNRGHESQLPSPVKSAIFRVSGTVSAEFQTLMEEQARAPLIETEYATTTLLNYQISTSFLKDARRGVRVIMPDKTPMFDDSDWANLTIEEKNGKIAAGFAKLIKYCGGDEASATAFTLVLGQRITQPFFVTQVKHPALNPVRMPDGKAVVVSGGQETINDVQLIPRDIAVGKIVPRFKFIHADQKMPNFHVGEEVPEYLDRESAEFGYSFEAHLNDNGSVEIDSPVTYYACVSTSAWNRPYTEPGISNLEGYIGAPLKADLLRFAPTQHAEHLVRTLLTLDRLRDASVPKDRDALVKILADDVNLPQGEIDLPAKFKALVQNRAHVQSQRQVVNRRIDEYGFKDGQKLSELKGWPKGCAEPASYEDLLKAGNKEAIDAFHEYLGEIEVPNAIIANDYLLDVVSHLGGGAPASGEEKIGEEKSNFLLQGAQGETGNLVFLDELTGILVEELGKEVFPAFLRWGKTPVKEVAEAD